MLVHTNTTHSLMGNKYQKYREHLTSTHNESERKPSFVVVLLCSLNTESVQNISLCYYYYYFKSHPVLHICWENFCCIFWKLKNVRYCAPSGLEMQGCLFSFKSNHCWRRKEGSVLFKPHSTYCWAWRNVIVLSFLLNWATAEEMLWLFYLFFQSLLSASQMGDDILMFLSLILFQPLLHNWLKGTYLFSVSS